MPLDLDKEYLVLRRKAVDTLRQTVPWLSTSPLDGLRNVLVAMLKEATPLQEEQSRWGVQEVLKGVLKPIGNWDPQVARQELPCWVTLIHSDNPAPDRKKRVVYFCRFSTRPISLVPEGYQLRGYECTEGLDHLDEESLKTEKLRVLKALAEIKDELDEWERTGKRISGEEPEQDWVRRVKVAKRLNGIRSQAIDMRLTEVRRQRRECSSRKEAVPPKNRLSLPQWFMVVAEERLSPELFGVLREESQKREQEWEDRQGSG